MNPGLQKSSKTATSMNSLSEGLFKLKQSEVASTSAVKAVYTRFSAKSALLFLLSLVSNLWKKLNRSKSVIETEIAVAEDLNKTDVRRIPEPHTLLVTPAKPLPETLIQTKEFPGEQAESEFSRDMAAMVVVPGVCAVVFLALEVFGISTIFTPTYDMNLVYSLVSLPIVFWACVLLYVGCMKVVLSPSDFRDQVSKTNNAYHHFVTAVAYVLFLVFNAIYFYYFTFGWAMSSFIWMITAVKDWHKNYRYQPGPHNDDFDGHKDMPTLAEIDNVDQLAENLVKTDGFKEGTEAENWSMATKYIPLYLFLFLRVFLVPNVWVNVISRIFLWHFNAKYLMDFDYSEDKYSKLCYEWILETCVGVYIKEVDLETETATWFMHNVCLSEYVTAGNPVGQMKVYPGMSIKLDLSSKRIISSELRDVDSTVSNISNQDLFQILVWLLLTRVHHKIHAGSVWNLDYESESIARRIQSATSVFYNDLGWNNPAFMQGLSGNSVLDIFHAQNALGDAFLTNMHSKMTSHGVLRKLRKYSKMVDFLVSLRNELKAPCVESSSKSKSHGEGVFLSAMHAIDHHTLNKVVPVDACYGNHWKWKCMADHNRAVFVMQTDENPLVAYPHKYNSPWATARQKHIYKMAKKINPEFAEELETCVIR